MLDNVLAQIQRKEWKIRDGVIVPYYVDAEHQKMMGELVPHDKLTLGFPYDTAVRGILLPFGVLCLNREYGGLDQEGYDGLGKLLRNESRSLGRFFIGSSSLDRFTRGYKNDPLPFLFLREVADKKVFFPTGYYAIGNR